MTSFFHRPSLRSLMAINTAAINTLRDQLEKFMTDESAAIATLTETVTRVETAVTDSAAEIKKISDELVALMAGQVDNSPALAALSDRLAAAAGSLEAATAAAKAADTPPAPAA